MKKLIATAAALMLLSAAPALAMGCCSGSKGKAGMCAKGGMAGMNIKGKKGGCCCEGMAGGGMSRRG
ncbi:hypothetical protein ASF24_06160 [Methylobacterium sp. Leaf86]|uniref:hypothetical protein n=1 Tax=Methylobacterium sp. Leaf86 TaxID=1736242 RepID=UPI0006FAAE1E|nr:hypothetical protein [Methylobacterium sp. Leaf86]KQO49771.1 hypothetical protein ASF24_06160 [Methylobacterium sp. Leaf86]